jgi:hypothetical protein
MSTRLVCAFDATAVSRTLDRQVKPDDEENKFGVRYFFDFRFLELFLFFEVFFGTFLPSALASERPIAIACLRLLTLRPDRPLFNVPALRFFIARPTLADAFFEYFRAMNILPVARK